MLESSLHLAVAVKEVHLSDECGDVGWWGPGEDLYLFIISHGAAVFFFVKPFHGLMIRSLNFFFLPTPLFCSIFPSINNLKNQYLSFRITWPRYVFFSLLDGVKQFLFLSLLTVLRSTNFVFLAVYVTFSISLKVQIPNLLLKSIPPHHIVTLSRPKILQIRFLGAISIRFFSIRASWKLLSECRLKGSGKKHIPVWLL